MSAIPKFHAGQSVILEIPVRPEVTGRMDVVIQVLDYSQALQEMRQLLQKNGLLCEMMPSVGRDKWYYRLNDTAIECAYHGNRLGFYTSLVEEQHLRRYYPPTNVSCDEFMKVLLKAKPKGVV